MNVFLQFSKSNGLYINPSKCYAYYGGVTEEMKQQIEVITGFKEGLLPFRYLEAPLSTRKLSIQQRQPLIDKITSRIKHWSARLLCFGGRLQLTKSVLFVVTNYWLQCFPLPKKVLKHIDSLCRSFLWKGTEELSRKSPVAWEDVCVCPREQED